MRRFWPLTSMRVRKAVLTGRRTQYGVEGAAALACVGAAADTTHHRPSDWREQAILRFRVQRKKALRLALEKLDATLAARGALNSDTYVGKATASRINPARLTERH